MTRGYLGIDVGSSATRVSVLDNAGRLLATTSAAYPTVAGPEGVVEQQPADWLVALKKALAALPAQAVEVAGVGLCGQTPTLVLVGADGEAVRPALTWQDTRARAEALGLADLLGDPVPLVGTALPWSAANMPAKLLWLARHEPASVERTRFLLQPKDYVAMALTGEAGSDPWSSKGICRVSDGAPASEVLSACGWASDRCPPVAPAWTARGAITQAAAARFGLPPGVPVSIGWSDALAQVLASGCYDRGSGFFFSGTSAIVGAAVPDVGGLEGLFLVPPSCSPRPLLYGPTQSSGAAVSWVADLLGIDTEEVASLAEEAISAPAFVPYLAGERAPWWDPDLRALFLGVSAQDGRAQFARAVLEGVCLSARHVLALVEAAVGSSVELIEVAGRGVGDCSWERLLLENLGVPLNLHDDRDLSARGAAMLGAVAAGVDLRTVAERLGDRVRALEPSAADVEHSRRRLERYIAAAEVGRAWRREAVTR